jgi:hypothetical protein
VADAGADADAGDALVARWIDRSSNHVAVVQTDPAAMPAVSSYLGRPVVLFTPVVAANAGPPDQWLQTEMSNVGPVDFGPGDVLLELVVATSPTIQGLGVQNSYGAVYQKVDQADPPYNGLQLFASRGTGGAPGGGIVGVNLLVSSVGDTEDGKFHLIGVERVGAVVGLRFDGAEVATQLAAPGQVVDNAANPLEIGGRPDGLFAFLGALGDVVLMIGRLAPGDRESLEAYLMAKYAITPFQ